MQQVGLKDNMNTNEFCHFNVDIEDGPTEATIQELV